MKKTQQLIDQKYKISHFQMDEIRIPFLSQPAEIQIRVFSPEGNQVAQATFYILKDHLIHSDFHDVMVIKDYRRKGIASWMYDYAEEICQKKIEPNISLSSDGQQFWNFRKSQLKD